MTSDEDAWRILARTPNVEQDLQDVVQAAHFLLPPTETLRPAGSEVVFHLGDSRYWADVSTFLAQVEDHRPLTYCLTAYGGNLRCKKTLVRRPYPAGIVVLAEHLRQEWDTPAHQLTRALLAVHDHASFWLREQLREQRTPDAFEQLNNRLCHLAAARLDGRLHAIASELAGSWSGEPEELVRTAQAIALPAAAPTGENTATDGETS